MSKFGGLIKETDKWNRYEQRTKDWPKIKRGLHALGKTAPDPDWSWSVKKVDKYFDEVCFENGLPVNYWYGSQDEISK